MHLSSHPIEIDKRGSCRIDGVKYPIVGFGTYPLTGKVCVKAVQQAVKVGYRIFDTATYCQLPLPKGRDLKGN